MLHSRKKLKLAMREASSWPRKSCSTRALLLPPSKAKPWGAAPVAFVASKNSTSTTFKVSSAVPSPGPLGITQTSQRYLVQSGRMTQACRAKVASRSFGKDSGSRLQAGSTE